MIWKGGVSDDEDGEECHRAGDAPPGTTVGDDTERIRRSMRGQVGPYRSNR